MTARRFKLGQVYATRAGVPVTIVERIHRGSQYDMVRGDDGVGWRFNRPSDPKDHGRLTGTSDINPTDLLQPALETA